MTPEQFVYWLQGRAELVNKAPTKVEWEAIKQHLALVFQKVTPPAPGTSPSINPVIDPNVVDEFRKLSQKERFPWEPPYIVTCGPSQNICATVG